MPAEFPPCRHHWQIEEEPMTDRQAKHLRSYLFRQRVRILVGVSPRRGGLPLTWSAARILWRIADDDVFFGRRWK